MKTITVTGGCGFIGSNFVKMALKAGHRVFNVDKLTYAGNLNNLTDIEDSPAYTFIKADIAEPVSEDIISSQSDIIINFAAETHVDRSILSSLEFIRTNVTGTANLLEYARKKQIRFIQISTDEIYGELNENEKPFTEDSPLKPRNPYSASKASADFLVQSYISTYDTDAAITRCSNNYGPYQFPEKFIPVVIYKALRNDPVPLYGDGRNVRDWIFVEDHCRAILDVALSEQRDIFNIGANHEMENRELAEMILDVLGKPHSLIKAVKDRPGHDRRYALNTDKIRERFGFAPEHSFRENLEDTVKWYVENAKWTESCMDGSYMEYFRKNYSTKGL